MLLRSTDPSVSGGRTPRSRPPVDLAYLRVGVRFAWSADVPSFHHDILVELFRSRGEIAAELLQTCGFAVAHARVELGSVDLSQVAPAEYRADVVVILRDDDGRAVTGVIVEIQRHIDPHKRWSWPVYVTELRAKLECPVVLLVVTPERGVATWARASIHLGGPASYVTPVVIGFDDVPWIRDHAEAQRSPELAVLSVLAHPDLEVAAAAIHAVSGLPEGPRELYFDVIMTALPAAVRHILETQMIEGYKYQSEFARRFFGEGEAVGEEKGREEGLREAVLALARIKLEAVTDRDVAAIEGAHDPRVLSDLVTGLGRAATSVEAREVLAGVLGYSNSRP
jgi:hypothetical protein